MRVTCESCGTHHEVDSSLAPLSGTWPSCPRCSGPGATAAQPAGNAADPLTALFDLGTPNFDAQSEPEIESLDAADLEPLDEAPSTRQPAAAQEAPVDDLMSLFADVPAQQPVGAAMGDAFPAPTPSASNPADHFDPLGAASDNALFDLLDLPAPEGIPGEPELSPIEAEVLQVTPTRDDLFAATIDPLPALPLDAPVNTPILDANAPQDLPQNLSTTGEHLLAAFNLDTADEDDESAPNEEPSRFEPLDLAGDAPGDAAFAEMGREEPGRVERVIRPQMRGTPPQEEASPPELSLDRPSTAASAPADTAPLSFEAARDSLSPLSVPPAMAGFVSAGAPKPSPHGDTASTHAHSPAPTRPLPSAMRRAPGIETSKIILFGLAVVLVLGALIWMWLFSDTAFSRDAQQAPPTAVAELLAAVRQSSPETFETANRSSADEHVQRGLSLLQDDTASSYELARASFAQALFVDPSRVDAVALYVEATLHVRPPEPYLERAHALINLALTEAPKSALSHRVYAFLLMHDGQEEMAIAEAEQAVSLALPEEKADALLMLGYAFLNKSAPVALEKIDQAVQRNPRLKRALYYKGLAAESAGELLQAVKAYEARLAIDAKERDSLQGLVRVYLKLGRHKDARAALNAYLKAYGNHGAPKLWEIALTLRFEKKPQGVAASLKRIERNFSSLTPAEKLLFHRLNAEYLISAGNLAAARKSVDAAIRLDPQDEAAHFLGLRIAIQRRDVQAASQHLESCRGALMPGLSQEYLGRIALIKGDEAEALTAFQKANEENPHRMATLLLEGVLLLRRGEERAAWSLHSKIIELDPRARTREPPAFDDFHAPERDILDLARPLLGTPRPDSENSTKWLYLIYGALLGFHSGEVSGPSRALDQVISGDPTSLISFAYRAQIELDRGDLKKAAWFIDTAISFEARAALPWYLKGRLAEAEGDAKQAHDAYLKVLEFSPRHIDAEIRLAELSIAQGDKADAIRRLRRVLIGRPHLEHVRGALFELERELPDGL